MGTQCKVVEKWLLYTAARWGRPGEEDMVKVESDRVSRGSRVNRGSKKKRERQTVSEFISWERALVGVTRETVSW